MNRDNQDAARRQILNEANKGLDKDSPGYLKPKQIQRAVFRCRQRQLVSHTVLILAGFNHTKRV